MSDKPTCITCNTEFPGSFTGECPDCEQKALQRFVSKPTGEWTVETNTGSNEMKRIMCSNQKIIGWTMRPFSESFQKIADAHNAALAAKDEQHAAATKLAAEKLAENHREQLAAEREALAECRTELSDERQAREDESKLIRTLSDDVMQLSKQLAAERETIANLRIEAKQNWKLIDQLRSQVQTLVDALTSIAWEPQGEILSSHADVLRAVENIAKAALAKVKGK